MRLLNMVTRIRDKALDLLFPPKCIGCGKEGAFLCLSCEENLPRLLPPFCEVCTQPVRNGTLCKRCIDSPLNIDGVRAPFLMEGAIRDLIHQFKYNDFRALAPVIALLLSNYLLTNPITFDLIMPVPIHKHRERQRGYNQADLIVKEIAKLANTPTAKGLKRVKDSPPQAKSPSIEERRANVKDAYIYKGQPINGKCVLLIDDVCTTGSTVDACAKVLKDAGASQVWGLTLAREA